MPAEQFLFGEGWTRDVDLETKVEQVPTPQEGLLSALNNVTPNRFPRIVVVDDSPEARRLIRRILQSQGDFEIFEATNGVEAIELVFLNCYARKLFKFITNEIEISTCKFTNITYRDVNIMATLGTVYLGDCLPLDKIW